MSREQPNPPPAGAVKPDPPAGRYFGNVDPPPMRVGRVTTSVEVPLRDVTSRLRKITERAAATAAPAIDPDLLAALRSALAEGVGVEDLLAGVERARLLHAAGTEQRTAHRDRLAEILRVGHRGPIVEADEWRPLADHVIALCGLLPRDLVFSCPACGSPSAQTVELDVDIHAGATYTCGECGGKVIFDAVTVEQELESCRPWTYCADALPREAGRYEAALAGTDLDTVSPFVAERDWIDRAWQGEDIPYAWRAAEPYKDAPPLRPADRTYLESQGVPPEWLGVEED